MSSDSLVETQTEGSVGLAFLNCPEQRNALSIPMRELLYEKVKGFFEDKRVRAVVIAGDRKAFCAGGDLPSLRELSPAQMLERQIAVQRLVGLLTSGAKPVIAAVEGYALGAGLSLALCCDLVVAGKGAQFGAVFGKVGLAPDLGLSWTLPRRVGLGRARLMVLTGRLISAAQGAQWGLVDELVDEGSAVEAAKTLVSEIEANAPIPGMLASRALKMSAVSLEQALDIEAVTQTFLLGTEDFGEGYAAFQARRSPKFVGR